MEPAYREDELLRAIIVDSEAYIYGKVEKVKIIEDDIVLLVCEEKPDIRTIVDIPSLKETLLKSVKTTFGSRLRRIALMDILANNVRKELVVRHDEELGDEHYIKYAERLAVPVPYVKAAVERREQKGTVNLKEIKSIKVTVLGKDKETKVIKVVLLQEPKEAIFRRIPVHDKAQFRATEAVRDKLVLDADGNALGYADSVVLFRDTSGIRVYILNFSGKVNLDLLTRYLEESGQAKVAALVQKHLMNPELHRYTVEIKELEDFMYQMKVTFRVPEKLITGQDVKEFVAEIPWSEISKIGDVVLLKSTLTELKAKGIFRGYQL